MLETTTTVNIAGFETLIEETTINNTVFVKYTNIVTGTTVYQDKKMPNILSGSFITVNEFVTVTIQVNNEVKAVVNQTVMSTTDNAINFLMVYQKDLVQAQEMVNWFKTLIMKMT